MALILLLVRGVMFVPNRVSEVQPSSPVRAPVWTEKFRARTFLATQVQVHSPATGIQENCPTVDSILTLATQG